jgi:protein-S-isoprenylcysteine O-methyltransferase Ste14
LRVSLSLTDILFLVVMVVLVYGHFQELLTGKVLSILFVLQQVTVIVFTLLHRPSQGAPAPWRDILLAWGGTLLPLAMQPNGSPPNPFGSLLVLIGVVLATGAVLSLGRSFGIEAANRGVQTHGLYRFVRHPIYAAYLPLIGGFLLAYPSWWNGLLFVAWMACQVARIQREEAVLSQDAAYQLYTQKVRRRLMPGVW